MLSVPVFVVCAGCDIPSGQGPLRGLPAGTSLGVTQRNAGQFPTWHYGTWTACLDGDHPVTIDTVDAQLVGGVRLTAVGAKRATDGGVAGWPGPLPARYAPAAGFTVTERCDKREEVEIVLELAVPDSGSSGVNGFTVRYHVGDRQYALDYPVAIVLCQGHDVRADPQFLDDCADRGAPAGPTRWTSEPMGTTG